MFQRRNNTNGHLKILFHLRFHFKKGKSLNLAFFYFLIPELVIWFINVTIALIGWEVNLIDEQKKIWVLNFIFRKYTLSHDI